MRNVILLCGLILLLSSSLLIADPPPKQVIALSLEEMKPTIDGRLDDPIWENAHFLTDFQQKEPNEFGEPTSKTEVAFAYDDEYFYVAATMWMEDPDEVSAIVTRRDNSGATDRIIVSLDTYNDRSTAYSFSVTAAGVRTDYYHNADSEFRRDFSFDPVWQAKTWIGTDRWTAEMRIPFSQLRFNDADRQTWGLNINRYIPNKREDIYWIVVPRGETGWSSRMGQIVGIQGVKPSTRVELLPYVAGGATIPSDVDPDDPYTENVNLSGRAGLDVKIGLGPNLTLDATVNPDFGQVEADPAEVNLSAFETFFGERRPFFVEGAGLFSYNGARHFYSRRIGASPHRFPSGNFSYADIPENSTILGAAKLTGRLSNGLSIGGLVGVTEREHAKTFTIATEEENLEEVEPLTFYGVGRLRQEFGEDASTVGIIGTVVRRDMDELNPNSAILPQEAITGGADWTLRFDGGTYELDGNIALSHVSGEEEAIARIQKRSAHYFQRPDADYVQFDSSRTSLTGYAATLEFERNGGDWVYETGFSIESPEYELNDIGSLNSADDIDVWGNIRYRENDPKGIFRNWSVGANLSTAWNYGWVRQSTRASIDGSVTWSNWLSNYLGGGFSLNGLSDKKTRGGPLMDETDVLFNGWTGMNNNFGSKTRWNWHLGFGIREYDGWFINTNAGLAMNLGDRLELSFNPGYYSELTPRQFVRTVEGGGEETFGRRYIFSNLRLSHTSIQVRLNYAVTPDLTLELYTEPFIASGEFSRFGELAQAGGSELISYDGRIEEDTVGKSYTVTDGGETFTISNPDFTSRSFRSNAVLRWEWLPGSTLYLVWQQNRSNYQRETNISKVNPSSWLDTLGDAGDNFLALKLSYWLPVD